MKSKYGYMSKAILALSFTLLISACSAGKTTESTTKPSESVSSVAGESLPAVELVWYYGQSKAQSDAQTVEDAVNKYLKDNTKLNAKLKLKPVDFGNYDQKLNAVVAGGEVFDLIWTSNWKFSYEQNAAKGAFLDMQSLLDKYAPKLKASIKPEYWEDLKVNGKLFAAPNYQIASSQRGMMIQKRFIDKYKLDVSTIKSAKDVEPFLELLKKSEPDVIPYSGPFIANAYGLEHVNDYLVYRPGDKTFKLVDKATTPEYKQFVEMKRNWFEKGYINKDEASIKNGLDLRVNGRLAVLDGVTISPGGEQSEKKNNGGFDVVAVPFTKSQFSGFASTLTAISRTSQNPERAMMLLELVNSDSKLFNLLSFGVENKHYTKINDQTVKVNNDAGYSPNAAWIFGNVTNGYLVEGQPADTWEATKKMNEAAQMKELHGFKIDPEPIKMWMANRKAVEDEFTKALDSGSVDPKTYLPQFTDKVQKSGSEQLIAEVQRQLDAWLKDKGKK